MTGHCLNFNHLYFDILMTTLRRVINCSSYLYPLHIFTEKCILSSFDGKKFNLSYAFSTFMFLKHFRYAAFELMTCLEAMKSEGSNLLWLGEKGHNLRRHSHKSSVHNLSRGLRLPSKLLENSKNTVIILDPHSLWDLKLICGGLKYFIYTKNS